MMAIAERAAHGWSSTTERRRVAVMVAAVLLCAIVPYLNSLANGFAYDDTFIIQANPRVHDFRDWRAIWSNAYWPWLGQELGLYRPLTIQLFALQWAVGNGAAFPFHLANVGLHAIVSVLVFLLLSRFTPRVPAMLGAIVFAVHPLHTEAVANMVGQAELVAAALVLGACLIHAGRPQGLHVSWPRRVVIGAMFGLALCAKESAVVLPGLLVLVDLLQSRVQLSRRGLIAYIDAMAFVIILIIVVLIAYLTARFDALGGTLVGTDAGPSFPYLKEHRLLNAFRAFPEYLRLLFYPADLTVDYAPATIFAVTSFTAMSIVGLILLIGLTLLMLLTPWFPLIGAAPAWFLISVSPVSNLFFPIGVLIAERTLYLPSVAVCLLVAFVATHLSTEVTLGRKRLATAAFACAVVAMGVRTWVRNPDWASTHAVQAAVFRDHPESYHAQWANALAEWGRANLNAAARWFEIAYRTYPRDSGMLSTYGAFMMAVGDDSAALGYTETSYEMHPFMPNSTVLLAFLYTTTHQYERALTMIDRGAQKRYPLAVTMAMRAYVFQAQGKLPEAAAAWKLTADRISTGKWLAHAYHARTLAYARRDDEAHDAVDRARPLAGDSTNQALLHRLDAAIRAGCYRDADPRAISDLYGPPNMPACDPLGSWFDRATSVHGATFSQFAIPRRLLPARKYRPHAL